MTKNSKKRRIFSIILLAFFCIVLLLEYLQVITANVKFLCVAFLVVIAGMAFHKPDKPFKEMTSHEKYMTILDLFLWLAVLIIAFTRF